MSPYYPDSKVEISGFTAKHYDTIMDIITLGSYSLMIQKAIQLMRINPADKILDLGAGTGRNACLMMKYLSKDGELIGLDISQEMIEQFKKKCAQFPNASIINKRIDQDTGYKQYFDKVHISFVLHGFPEKIREQITRNAFNALKSGSEFFILDYSEFSIKEMPFYLRIPFKRIECKYAFDFIEIDRKKMLSSAGFTNFEEHFFMRGYVRLLRCVKPST
jgi:demethylmenaquinone methyltransferase/2-methoxy-6-polyprenyl-1,4-benzoquinol methylase